jgi:hypothetical protein
MQLTFNTVQKPEGGDNGELKKDWLITWGLPDSSVRGGWIVQKLDVKLSSFKRAGHAEDADSPIDFAASYPVWEAWKIPLGFRLTDTAAHGDLKDDSWGTPDFGGCTSGTYTITASAEFYEGLRLPADFIITNEAPTFDLPATRNDPGKLPGGTGAKSRTLTVRWDSIDGDGSNMITFG